MEECSGEYPTTLNALGPFELLALEKQPWKTHSKRPLVGENRIRTTAKSTTRISRIDFPQAVTSLKCSTETGLYLGRGIRTHETLTIVLMD